ncbi:MAG: hypothetical protein ABSB09_01500 [Acidimicrobiales bacterium]
MSDTAESIAPDWTIFEVELRRRESDSMRASLASYSHVVVQTLDDAFHSRDTKFQYEPFFTFLHETFVATRDLPETPVLLATYCYAALLKAWELVLPCDHVRKMVEGVKVAALAAMPAGEFANETLVRSVVGLADSVVHAMKVENALNCSCPVGMKSDAREVVKRARAILDDLDDPIPGYADCQAFIRKRAEIDCAYFEAVVATAEGVEAYIEGGPEATDTLRERIADVHRAEQNDLLRDDVYQSELRVHRLALTALQDAWPRIHVDRAEIIYCYPFAVRSGSPGVQIEARDVVAAARDHGEGWLTNRGPRPGGPDAWLKRGVSPIVKEIELSDMWDGSEVGNDREGRFAGTAVVLPTVYVTTTASEEPLEFDVELRICQLGNHYLRVQRPMVDESLHALNQAIRRGSASMGEERVTFGDATFGDRQWKKMADLAHDLITNLVGYLGTESPDLRSQEPKAVIPHSSEEVIFLARQLSLEGSDGWREEATIDELTASAGASLLLQPVHGATIALEEWVRYPIPETAGANLLGDYGFKGDFLYRTTNTSFGYFPGLPEFLILEQMEAAEFVASLSAPLVGWLEEIQAISSPAPDKHPDPDEGMVQSREILTKARIKLAQFRSSDLCLRAVHRELLDRSFVSAGIPKLEQDLEAQFDVAHTYLAELSAKQAKERDQRQTHISNVLGFTAVFFGLASVATILQLANSGFSESRSGIQLEVVVIIGLAVVTAILVSRLMSVKGPKPSRRGR